MKKALKRTLLTAACGVMIACGETQQKTVIATIDGEEVYNADFVSYMAFKQYPEKHRSGYMDRYIDNEGLVAAIEKLGFIDDTLEAELQETRRQLIIKRYFESISSSVNQEDISNFYESQSKQFETPKAHVAHLLITTQEGMSEEALREKYDKANEAYQQLKNGAVFASVVSEYSEDFLTKDKAGDLGWIKQGEIHPELSRMAFERLRVGEISKPFQTQFGFHVMKLLEEHKIEKKPIKEVGQGIKILLAEEKKIDQKAELLESVAIVRHEEI